MNSIQLTRKYEVCGDVITIKEFSAVDESKLTFGQHYNILGEGLMIDYQTWNAVIIANDCVNRTGCGEGYLNELEGAVEEFQQEYAELVLHAEKVLRTKEELVKYNKEQAHKLESTRANLKLNADIKAAISNLDKLYSKLNRCTEEKVTRLLIRVQEQQELVNSLH